MELSQVPLSIPPPFDIGITPASLLYAFGVGQAFLLAFALWNKPSPVQNTAIRQQRIYNPHHFLVLLIALLGIVSLEHFLEVTGYFYYLPRLTAVSEPLALLFGPLLFFYVKTMTNPIPLAYRHRHLLHLLPFLLVCVLYLPSVLAEGNEARLLKFYAEYYLAEVDVEVNIHLDGFWGSMAIFDFSNYQAGLVHRVKTLVGVASVYFLVFKIDWLCHAALLWTYIGLSFRCLQLHKKNLCQVASYIEKIDLKWIRYIILLSILIIAAFTLQIFVIRIFDGDASQRQLSEHLSRSLAVVLVYFIGFNALRQPQIFSSELRAAVQALRSPPPIPNDAITGPPPAPLPQKPEAGLQPSTTKETKAKYQRSSLPQALSEPLAKDVLRYVKTQKPYLNSKLTLPQLADELGLTTHVLSQLLNETIGKNFFDFINTYRVEEAQRKLQGGSSDGQTILDVAMESGFNSHSAFYNAFKKHAGMTPSQWKKMTPVLE